MKGATALPSVITMSKPIIRSRNTIGPSHHFLRVFKKSQNSESMESFFSCLIGSSTKSPVLNTVLDYILLRGYCPPFATGGSFI